MDPPFSFKVGKPKEGSLGGFKGGFSGGSLFSKGAVSNPFKYVANKGNAGAESANSSSEAPTKNENKAKPDGGGGFLSSGMKPGFLTRQSAAGTSSAGEHPRTDSKGFFGSAISGSGIGFKPSADKKLGFNKFKIVNSSPAERPESPSQTSDDEKVRPAGIRSRLAPFRTSVKTKVGVPEYSSSREHSPARPVIKKEYPTEGFKLSKNVIFADRTTKSHSSSLNSEQREVIRLLSDLRKRECEDEYSRYLLLDERDKLMCRWRAEMEKLSPPKDGRNRQVQASCKGMCTEKEKYARTVQKKISPFECHESGDVDNARLVKEFARSAADQEKPLPHELRTPELLQYTMNYLLTQVIDAIPSNQEEIGGWYDFLWNRTRALRKEITQLMLSNELAVSLVESCTRLHIVCAYLLCSLEQEKFDQKMNTENLGKCLQSLRHLYEDLDKVGIHCPSEAEFRAYDVMLYLHDSNVLRQVLSYRKEVRESKPVRLAMQLFSAMQTKNYVKFFRLMKTEATFLQCCICHRFFSQVRSQGLAVMVKSYPRNSTFELDKLASILAFDDRQSAMNILMEYGIRQNDMNDDEVDFAREEFFPTAVPTMVTYKWIDDKKLGFLSETINGGPILPSTIVPEVVDSFENGCYTRDPVLREFLARFSDGKQEVIQLPQAGPPQTVDVPTRQPPKEALQSQWFQPQPIRKVPEVDVKAERKKVMEALVEETSQHLFDGVVDAVTRNIVSKEFVEEKKIVEERERQESHQKKRNCARETVQSLEELILKEIISQELLMAIEQERKVVLREEAGHFCQEMTEKMWEEVLQPYLDKQLKNMLKSFLKSEIRIIEQGLQRHKKNVSLLWLRQFWDQWRSFVAVRKENRQQRNNAWNEFRPKWNCDSFTPIRYLSSSPSTALSNSPQTNSRRQIALADFRRKRVLRITRNVVDHWKEFAKKRSKQRGVCKVAIQSARRSRPLSRLNSAKASSVSDASLGFLREIRRKHREDDSPIRKTARLSLEESFSFPTLSKPDEFELSQDLDGSDFPVDVSFNNCSMVSENDLALARRAVERSFVMEPVENRIRIERHTEQPVDNSDIMEETHELISEARRGNKSAKDMQQMASELAASVLEHQNLLDKMIQSTLSRRAAN